MSSIKEGVCRLLVSNEQEFVNVDTYLINELAERQFKRYEIEGDGHCLLNAIKHQLRNSNLLLPSISVWREAISLAMSNNVADICSYFHISGKEEVDALVEHINNFKLMRSVTGVVEWGNEYTLYQICKMYKLHVTVLSPFRLRSGAMFLHEQYVFEDNRCDYERIFLCRSNTSHYDSVVDLQVFQKEILFIDETHFIENDTQSIDDLQINSNDSERSTIKHKLSSTIVNAKKKEQRLMNEVYSSPENNNDNKENRVLKRKLST
jgi:OTU-like cysteine protease